MDVSCKICVNVAFGRLILFVVFFPFVFPPVIVEDDKRRKQMCTRLRCMTAKVDTKKGANNYERIGSFFHK